jgi:putative transposase
MLVTSDAHAGLVAAVGATMGGASWQRCRTHYAANLMAVCPKHAWPGVKALLHSVYDQPDAKAVHAQFDKLLDTIADKLPEIHDHLDQARADILAFTAFPKEIWRQIWSNNPTRDSTARSGAAPTSSGSSPTAPPPSASSEPSSPSSTTTGSKAAATSDSTSWPDPESP